MEGIAHIHWKIYPNKGYVHIKGEFIKSIHHQRLGISCNGYSIYLTFFKGDFCIFPAENSPFGESIVNMFYFCWACSKSIVKMYLVSFPNLNGHVPQFCDSLSDGISLHIYIFPYMSISYFHSYISISMVMWIYYCHKISYILLCIYIYICSYMFIYIYIVYIVYIYMSVSSSYGNMGIL